MIVLFETGKLNDIDVLIIAKAVVKVADTASRQSDHVKDDCLAPK